MTCDGDLTAPLWFTRNGVAAVDFVLTCPKEVVPPTAAIGMGLKYNSTDDVSLYSAAPNTAPKGKTSYAWRWVLKAVAEGTPEPALDGGLRTVVFVKLCPSDQTAVSESACAQSDPSKKTGSSKLRGGLLAVTIRERSTFANLTGWVQALGALFTALIALIGGLIKAIKKPSG